MTWRMKFQSVSYVSTALLLHLAKYTLDWKEKADSHKIDFTDKKCSEYLWIV